MEVSEAPGPWWAPDVVQMCSTVGSTSRLRQEHTTTAAAATTIWSQNQIYTPYSEDAVIQIRSSLKSPLYGGR